MKPQSQHSLNDKTGAVQLGNLSGPCSSTLWTAPGDGSITLVLSYLEMVPSVATGTISKKEHLFGTFRAWLASFSPEDFRFFELAIGYGEDSNLTVGWEVSFDPPIVDVRNFLADTMTPVHGVLHLRKSVRQ